MVEEVRDRFSRIDILVNCAFWGPSGSLEQTDEACWDRTLDTCLKAPCLCTRAVHPTMRAQRSGTVVNIGSMAGKMGEDNRPAYRAAKAWKAWPRRSTSSWARAHPSSRRWPHRRLS